MLTDNELQSLRNLGNEAEAAADEIAKLRADVALLRTAMEDAFYQMSKARIWGGMDWHYNQLHPMHYRPAMERLRQVLDRA
jgi:hypothetical protein